MTSPAAHCSVPASATVTVSTAQCQHSVNSTLNTWLQAAQRQSVGLAASMTSYSSSFSCPQRGHEKLSTELDSEGGSFMATLAYLEHAAAVFTKAGARSTPKHRRNHAQLVHRLCG
jgi:hypothetical protein